MKELRFGIIGTGMIANYHARAIGKCENARLVAAVGGKNIQRSEDFCKKYNIKIHDSIESLISDEEIDAVCICTPTGLHMKQAIACMEKGKHVVIEKPIALNLEEGNKVLAASIKNNVTCIVISQFRYKPAAVEVRKAVSEGVFGRICSSSLSMPYFRSDDYYNSAEWRGTWNLDGGGALMNQGIHGVDVLCSIMGEAKSVYGITRTMTRKIEVEDTAVALVEFKSGAIGTIEASTTSYPGFPRRICIYGDKGSVIIEEDRIVYWKGTKDCPIPVQNGSQDIDYSNPSSIDDSGHIYQIQNFINHILKGEELLGDARTGLEPLKIIDAIYKH